MNVEVNATRVNKNEDVVGENTKQTKREAFSLSFVIRLGLEPKTPTLKVLCSTD